MANIHDRGHPASERKSNSGRRAVNDRPDHLLVNVAGGPNNFSRGYEVTPVGYRSRETGIHYITEDVVHTEWDAAAVMNDTPCILTNGQIFFSIVGPKVIAETALIGGGETIRVNGRRQGQSSLLVTRDIGSVNVSDTSPTAGNGQSTTSAKDTTGSPRTGQRHRDLRVHDRRGLRPGTAKDVELTP